MGTWFARQVVIFALSSAATALWLTALMSLIGVPLNIYLLLLVAALSALVPALSLLEAGGRSLVRREYKMGLFSCLMMAGVLIALPFTTIYLYLIGECLQCRETYWDVGFAIIIFAIPAAVFQTISYKAVKSVLRPSVMLTHDRSVAIKEMKLN